MDFKGKILFIAYNCTVNIVHEYYGTVISTRKFEIGNSFDVRKVLLGYFRLLFKPVKGILR